MLQGAHGLPTPRYEPALPLGVGIRAALWVRAESSCGGGGAGSCATDGSCGGALAGCCCCPPKARDEGTAVGSLAMTEGTAVGLFARPRGRAAGRVNGASRAPYRCVSAEVERPLAVSIPVATASSTRVP